MCNFDLKKDKKKLLLSIFQHNVINHILSLTPHVLFTAICVGFLL